MDKDKRLPYSAPFLRIQEFTPSEYADVCSVDVKEVEYAAGSPILKVLWDFPIFGEFDDKDKVYDYTSYPSPLYANMGETKTQSFLNDNTGDLRNICVTVGGNSAQDLYKIKSNGYTKISVAYAVHSIDGNDYFFSSKPTLKKSHS